jgi:hypothetical protein
MNNDWASHFVDPILGSFPLWVMGRHRVTPLFPSKRTFTARFARPLSASSPRMRGSQYPGMDGPPPQPERYWNILRGVYTSSAAPAEAFREHAAPLASGREGSDLTSEEIE